MAQSPSQSSPGGDDEFVWRFRLDDGEPQTVYRDPLLELIRVQWEELLKLTVPRYQGKEIKIDSFSLMRDPAQAHAIFRDNRR